MIDHCKRTLLARASEWQLPVDGKWTFLFHNNYQPSGSSINLLWFHGNEPFPNAVAKICRSAHLLEREGRSLTTAHRAVGKHVPRPLDFYSAEGFWVLWMSGVPGFRVPPRRRYARAELIGAVDMVVSIHGALKSEHPEGCSDRHERMVAKPLKAVAEFGNSPAVRAGCAALAEATAGSYLRGLPVIPQHGDLFLDNVLHFRDQWHVVDWESFGAVDLPFYDLLTLLLSVLGTFGELPANVDGKVVQQIPFLAERYATGIGLPETLISTLLPLTLVNRFYLNWIEKRDRLTDRLYRGIEGFFTHKQTWDEIFGVSATTARSGIV